MNTENPVRLLVVDDEPHIADLVATVARYEGWQAVTAGSGEAALAKAAEFVPDIVVLDLMLPGIDGFTVLDKLREAGTAVPVVFLTAKDATADRVAGLTRGGDDYLVKPFSVEELMARLRAVLRRSTNQAKAAVLRVGDLTLNEDTREVARDGKPADLTPTEYELLRYLMRHSPSVMTKAQILDHVWEYDFGGRSNVVELVISHLRRKLDTGDEPLIHTVRGVGYVVRQAAR
ncbi:Putative transcriptional regulatory protein TcrX [Amycolatopsis japonica]|uniref:DNA-binding response regulator n=2 Tax=Amycolatopsis japonica group TaxID=2893673 RepID=A0A1W2M0Q6_9PSEU|nr:MULTISPECIES: response regulator transcription factor [Amycolatopsis]AIG74651.1 Putative transcriptional regulatory protein TcrX [Amycolatopsis japonica]ONF72741.1 DNA-binding response regulator [Amycolatopsis keratiniphila subsp. keratiniphila]RSN27184.1 DNA-binding response regulator [Amycolatopsis sp. WAC 04169]